MVIYYVVVAQKVLRRESETFTVPVRTAQAEVVAFRGDDR